MAVQSIRRARKGIDALLRAYFLVVVTASAMANSSEHSVNSDFNAESAIVRTESEIVMNHSSEMFAALSGCAAPIDWHDNRTSSNKSARRAISFGDNRDDFPLNIHSQYAGMAQFTPAGEIGAGGIFRIGAEWQPRGQPHFGSGGNFRVTVDHRHNLLDDTGLPNLGRSTGYRGATALFFNDAGTAILDLNWLQRLNDGSSAIVLGRYDPNDYLNMLGYAHPWASFSNAAVLFDASLATPDSSWGLGAMRFIDDQWYVLGMLNDVNGSQTDGLQLFDGGVAIFALAEFGWSPSRDQRCTSNWNVSIWHANKRANSVFGSSHGVLISGSWMIRNDWMPFLRVGLSDGATPIYNRSLTIGVIHQVSATGSTVGMGVNWGTPSQKELPSQTTLELFYRLGLNNGLTITPSIQRLVSSKTGHDDAETWVVGVRLLWKF